MVKEGLTTSFRSFSLYSSPKELWWVRFPLPFWTTSIQQTSISVRKEIFRQKLSSRLSRARNDRHIKQL